MTKPLNLIGLQFNFLKVISRQANNKDRRTMWLCKCNCGKEKIVVGKELISKKIQSCGCKKIEQAKINGRKTITHNLSRTRFYRIWKHIHQRCNNQKTPYYKNYGGRGISVCTEWINFINFYDDMFDSYQNHC